ncbi:MAG TPA: restriction endonuclease, partial [Armatimonadota bacterium]|nr:restriction endonuclease [Armatimonadota bacterium]
MRRRSPHAEWLSLVEVSGPFLTLSVLDRTFRSGLETHAPAVYRRLQEAHAEWEESRGKPGIHRAWVRFLLQDVLGYPDECLLEGQDTPKAVVYEDPTHHERVQPTLLIVDPQEPDRPKLPVLVVPPGQKPDSPLAGSHWPASPLARMQHLLQGAGLQAGFVTNGATWSLVHVRKGEPTGYVTWQTALLAEEPITLQAFRSLLGVRRVYGSAAGETLLDLLNQSAADHEEVTRELGRQVRHAVDGFLNALERLDRESGRQLLAEATPKQVYDAALTVMMRLVFLLCAEQNDLLPQGDLYSRNYAVSTLNDQLREAAQQHGEEVLEHRHDAWLRLLATFRLIHGGCTHEDLKLPAYGGSLFDPTRYPFLEGEPGRALRLDNRVVLHLLDALEFLEMRVSGGKERRRLSFRALGVEEIGHVYEGLLDHTARRAEEPTLGLIGKETEEPELPLALLEGKAQPGREALLAFLATSIGRSAGAVQTLLDAEPPPHRLGQLLAACASDEALAARVRPFLNLVRTDSLEHLQVYPAGALFMTAGQDRRSTGTHYTPVTLTEEIVRYTLEPLVYTGPADGLPRDQWKLHSPRELLALKVCDPAMGSGAFLVQACRYLAERLVEAWDREGQPQDAEPATFPELGDAMRVVRVAPAAKPSVPHAAELVLPEDPEERLAIARRLVADHCLYGVDRNPMAVEMAKLSLWLVTLAKGKPFTFLDHRLKHGDSLVGCMWRKSNGELRPLPDHIPDEAYRTRPGDASIVRSLRERNEDEQQGQLSTETVVFPAGSVDDYRKLAEFPDDPEGQRLKAERYRHLRESPEAYQRRLGADLWCSPWFWRLSDGVGGLCPTTGLYRAVLEEGKEPPREVLAEIEHLRERIPFFHWALEFPDAYAQDGFNAVVSNPPFQGGQKITGALGTDYRDYLVEALANGQRGSADLCAYFFLQAGRMLRDGGHFGMLATNTIAQGDTREVGLEQLTNGPWTIIRAVASQPWPGAANLEVAVTWVRRGNWRGERVLEGEPVTGITPFLTIPGTATGKPYRLKANEGKCFQGSIVLGMGFVLTPEEAQSLIDKNPNNRDVLSPYLHGEDLNSRVDQSPSRWVINFRNWPLNRSIKRSWWTASDEQRREWTRGGVVPHDYPLPVAADYPQCLTIVEQLVRPQRLKQNDRYGQEYWWRYLRPRDELYEAISQLDRVTAVSLVNNHLGFAYSPTGIVFAHRLAVFAIRDGGHFATLQSGLHYHWAWQYSSTMRADINYSPSDCVETFPFPVSTAGLDAIGERY